MNRRDHTTGQYVPSTASNHDRFHASYAAAPAGCWLWQAGCTGAGYGAFWSSETQSQVLAHIWSWVEINGPVPAGLVLDHDCHNASACTGGATCPHRRCVNPAHLTPKPRGNNVLASSRTNASVNAAKTHCDRGHPLTGENLIVVSNSRNPARPPWRQCRTCVNRAKRERRARESVRRDDA